MKERGLKVGTGNPYYYNAKEVMQLFGYNNLNSVYKLVYEGKLKRAKTISSAVLFDRDYIDGIIGRKKRIDDSWKSELDDLREQNESLKRENASLKKAIDRVRAAIQPSFQGAEG